MKVIVLGASGQIGSAIFDGLRSRHDVTGTSRTSHPEYFQFDPFNNNWSLLGNADVVVNCIGQIHATKASSFHDVHVEVTKLLIGNREAIGNPRIIQMSALGASADHKVEFLRTKGVADDLLLCHPDTVVVRPSIVCTHGTMVVRKIMMMRRLSKLTHGILFVPKGFLKTRIQPVMPQDLVDVLNVLCQERHPPRIVHVVGPRALSFLELIEKMSAAANEKFRLLEVPKALSDAVVNHCIGRFFPSVVSSQQYQLLFDDNVAEKEEVEAILHRPLISTEDFFTNELKNAGN